MPATRLLIVRHAVSTWNEEGLWQGTADPPLSPKGKQQAAEAGETLASEHRADPFTAVVSSDLQRARSTAGIAAESMGWTEGIHVERGLREYDVGKWSGMTHAAIEERWPGMITAWRAGKLDSTPGGEARVAFDKRAGGAVLALARSRPGARILAFSHGGTIAAIGRFAGKPLSRIRHLSGCELRIDHNTDIDALEVAATLSLLGEAPPSTDGREPQSRL